MSPVSASAVLLLWAWSIAAEPSAADQKALRVKEAEAIVKIYEIRLFNAKVKAKQDDVKFARFKKQFQAAQKVPNSLPEVRLNEMKEKYDWWELENKVKDWQEVEAELELAKVRLEMVKSGIRVYRGESVRRQTDPGTSLAD